MGNGQVNKEELNKKAERVVGGDRQPAPAPGKSTLKIDEDPSKNVHPSTGSDYIDKEGVTSDGYASDLLTTKQRDLLVNNFQQRVLEASTAFHAALMQVRMDKLLEKPEDMSWILSLAIGAIGWYGGVILSKVASSMLKEGSKSLIKRFLSNEIDLDSESSAKETRRATWVVEKLAVANESLPSRFKSVGKVFEKQVVDAGANRAKGRQKSDIDFIGILGDQAGVMFSKIRENQMMGKNDVELIALHDSWEATHHTMSSYVDEIKRQIALYNTSDIKNVGRSKFNSFIDGPIKDPGQSQDAIGGGTGHTATIDRFVVRLTFMSGYGARYAIADKYINLPDYPVSPPSKDDDGQLHEGKLNGNAMKYIFEKYSIIKLVEPELAETAIAKHITTWGAEPKILVINDISRNREQGPGESTGAPTPYSQTSPKKDSGSYGVQETKDLNYNDPKTWRYQNDKVT